MKKDLFRQKAVDHISNPDTTEQLVTQPQLSLWIVLGGILIILLAIILAAMIITVPLEVSGMGLIVQNGTGLEALFFVPLETGKTISPGMEAHISPISVDIEAEGYVTGTVLSVSSSPVNRSWVAGIFGSPDLADAIIERSGSAPFAVRASIDPGTDGGRLRQSPGILRIEDGTPVWGAVVIKETKAISLILPWSGQPQV